MTVKLIRFSSGEDVIAKVLEDTEETLVVQDAIVAVPSGTGTLGFVQWSPLLSKDVESISVNKRFVVYISEPDVDVVGHYNKMFSKIITPNTKLIQ